MSTLDDMIANARAREIERGRAEMLSELEEEQRAVKMRTEATRTELIKKFGAEFEAALSARHDVDSELRGISYFRHYNRPYIIYARYRDELVVVSASLRGPQHT